MHQMSSNILAAAVFFMIINYAGCKNQNQLNKPETPMTLEFSVDTALLERPVLQTNLNLTYASPLNWKSINQDDFEKLKLSIAGNITDSGFVNIVPVNLFAADSLKGILAVSEVEFSKTKDEENEIYFRSLNEYRELLYEKFKENKITETEYLKDGIRIKQFLIQMPDRVFFKLIFRNNNGKIIQFDYITKREYYIAAVKSIESSIGSIKLTHINQKQGEVL